MVIRLRERIRPAVKRYARDAAALLAGALTALGAVYLGLVTASDDLFVVMGFDPDRAKLLTALVVTALVVVVAAVISGRRLVPMLVGIAAAGALFGPTFAHETRLAFRSTGTQGTFDAVGWVLSSLALVVVAATVAWATSVLGTEVRRAFARAWRRTRRRGAKRAGRAGAWLRMTTLVTACVAVGAAFTVLGMMLNYTPDVLLRQGGPSPFALSDNGTGGGSGSSDVVPEVNPSATPNASSAGFFTGPYPGSVVSEGAWSGSRPWLAWRPVGGGSVTSMTFPAPWVNAGDQRISVNIYLPGDYATGTRRYPSTYVVPWLLTTWDPTAHATHQLDALIARGTIPAQIVVFVRASDVGPYPASACANSVDGRDWWERYITDTVVRAIDVHFRTIPEAAARSAVGFSEGGFCAAMLVSRHPDLFGAAGAISGYFDAVPKSHQGAAFALVFGGNRQAIAAYSPSLVLQDMAEPLRRRLFFTLVADPAEPFYGKYYRAFGGELAQLGIPCALLPTIGLGHSWQQAREEFGPLLVMLAGHLVTNGVLNV